jgi:hypothetical protein
MEHQEIHNSIESAFSMIFNLLNEHRKSKKLQLFFTKYLTSFIYAHLITNFFRNLNTENIKSFNLPKGKIGEIKKNYSTQLKNAKDSIKGKGHHTTERDYLEFKNDITEKYNGFLKIAIGIEKEIQLPRIKKKLKEYEKKIKQSGRSEFDLDLSFKTTVLEHMVGQNVFTIPKNFDEKIYKAALNSSHDIARLITSKNRNSIHNSMSLHRKTIRQFERSLYIRWKKAIDLFELIILTSRELGDTKLQILTENKKKLSQKDLALIKIHSRSVQVANEILVLIKSGFADGANARWRSLHELAIISLFLNSNETIVSKRYLDHSTITSYKRAMLYNEHYDKLGYVPIDRKELNALERKKISLCQKYKDNFYEDYGWIPKDIIKKRTFKDLERYVDFDKFRPFYNLSCAAVHGGSSGFYRLGLTDEYQEKVLLSGPTNYGFADPLQNSSISLLLINSCIMNLIPSFESIVYIKILTNYFDELGPVSVEIQNNLERDEKKLTKNQNEQM